MVGELATLWRHALPCTAISENLGLGMYVHTWVLIVAMSRLSSAITRRLVNVSPEDHVQGVIHN